MLAHEHERAFAPLWVFAKAGFGRLDFYVYFADEAAAVFAETHGVFRFCSYLFSVWIRNVPGREGASDPSIGQCIYKDHRAVTDVPRPFGKTDEGP